MFGTGPLDTGPLTIDLLGAGPLTMGAGPFGILMSFIFIDID